MQILLNLPYHSRRTYKWLNKPHNMSTVVDAVRTKYGEDNILKSGDDYLTFKNLASFI